MDIANEYIIPDDDQDDEQQQYEERIKVLKPEINNLLHCYLPGHITIKQAEALAIHIHQIITNPDDFLPKQ